MFKNFFLTAHRNIVRNKIQSTIQVSSLAIGLTAFILIMLYASFELRYDRYNEKFDRIYRLEYGNSVGMPTAVGHRIKTQVSEVENVVRFVNWHGKDYEISIETEDQNGEKQIVFVEDWFHCDSSVFNIFTFDFIQGNASDLLTVPYTCVLSASTAKQLFGDEDPVGQFVGDFKVEGVFRDLHQSHLEMNYLTSLVTVDQDRSQEGINNFLDNYGNAFYMTYLLLNKGADPELVTNRINGLLNINNQDENGFYDEQKKFSLRPLGEVYFENGSSGEKNYCRHGNRKLVVVLMTIALFTLVLAVINYINLTTARASLRAREVGVRKAMGSSRKTLVIQFLVEAVLVAIFSMGIALTLIQLLIPGFNRLADTDVRFHLLDSPLLLIMYIMLGIVLGIISGLYPSIYLTRFNTIKALSGATSTGTGQSLFRRTLLTFQFMVSVILIVGVMVILKQIHYMKTADLGFNREMVVNFNSDIFGGDPDLRKTIKEKLSANPDILSIGFSNGKPGQESVIMSQIPEVNGISKPISLVAVDPDFFDVLEIDVIEGRNFSWDRPADFPYNPPSQQYRFLFNESAVRQYELEDPVGFKQNLDNGGSVEIIGVVKDFNYSSQHKKIEPTFYGWFDYLGVANVKIVAHKIPETLQYIESVMQDLTPDWVFRYSFLDEFYERQYHRDEKTAVIISLFALIAVLIACLGLYGLSSFMALRRTKEIGIRKSLGASERSVFLLLSREFSKWVLLAIGVSVPLSWLVMDRWLQNFAYRTNLSWWIFILAITVTFLITFVTVTGQSLKTARTNPAESLRDE